MAVAWCSRKPSYSEHGFDGGDGEQRGDEACASTSAAAAHSCILTAHAFLPTPPHPLQTKSVILPLPKSKEQRSWVVM